MTQFQDKIIILLFSIEVSVILLFLSYKLTTGRGKSWYKKSPRFYLSSNVLSIFTLLNIIVLNIKEFFIQDEVFSIFFREGTFLGRLAPIYLMILFLLGALGFVWVGIKSKSIINLVIGFIFLFGLLYTASFIISGSNN